MNKQSLLFERILRGDLRPWLEGNKLDEKFAGLTAGVKMISPNFQPLYDIEFDRCFNQKTKYYNKLIVSEANGYCNRIIDLIRGEDDLRIIQYLLSNILKKKLRTLLMDVGKLIRANDYDIKYINPYKSDFGIDTDHKSETFIIQLLKTALIKVYLEIQEAFKTYVQQEEYLETEDLFLQGLSEAIPEQTFLKKRIQLAANNIEVKTIVIHAPAAEELVLCSFTYHQFIKKGENLIDLRDNLIKNRFIDKNTSFREFKRIFSGKEVLKPVRWTGNESEFYYFVYLIYTKYKLVKDLKQNQWKVACRCFVKEDGTSFDRGKVKNLKRPQTGGLIEKAVALLING